MLTIDMPTDVYEYVLAQQFEIKKEKGVRQYNQPQTIYALLREHKELKQKIREMEEELERMKKELSDGRNDSNA